MDCAPTKKSKKRFQSHWFNIDESLKVWLQEVSSDESKCFCKACNKILDCGLSEIRKHSLRQVHIKNLEQMLHKSNEENSTSNLSVTEPVSELLQTKGFDQGQNSSLSLRNKIKVAEIKYAAFVAEHNIPLSLASNFLALMKDIGQDPQVLRGMKVGRTKCKQLITNVLCVRKTERTVNNVRHKKYIKRPISVSTRQSS